MRTSHCRSCGAEIIWARTDSGHLMPVDAHPDAEGRLALSPGDPEPRVSYAFGNGERSLHRPHFATCPDADSWRRRDPAPTLAEGQR